MGDTVTLFVDRCVMCTRCVRFTREITGTSELMVINRGSHEEIDVFPGYSAGQQDVGQRRRSVPGRGTGRQGFSVQAARLVHEEHDGVCAGCSTGCSIEVEENQDRVYRLKPRENPHVNQWWMCDEGRYGYHHVHKPERQIEPKRRAAAGSNGQPARPTRTIICAKSSRTSRTKRSNGRNFPAS